MSNIIVDAVNALKARIDTEGEEVDGTREIVGVYLPPLLVHEMDLIAEENSIRSYYSEKAINIQAIRSLEHNLYEFIYRGLRQAVEQLQYFDKTQTYTSRRFVFSTTDCIAFVQILFRNGSATLFAHIRSTDVVKMLAWDVLFLCKLIGRVLEEAEFPLATMKRVIITIGCAHFYLKPAAMY